MATKYREKLMFPCIFWVFLLISLVLLTLTVVTAVLSEGDASEWAPPLVVFALSLLGSLTMHIYSVEVTVEKISFGYFFSFTKYSFPLTDLLEINQCDVRFQDFGGCGARWVPSKGCGCLPNSSGPGIHIKVQNGTCGVSDFTFMSSDPEAVIASTKNAEP